jgi:hypothetical protein
MKLQKPCVEKKLDPPVVDWDGTPAPVCDPSVATIADGIRVPETGSIIVIVATDAPLTPDQMRCCCSEKSLVIRFLLRFWLR